MGSGKGKKEIQVGFSQETEPVWNGQYLQSDKCMRGKLDKKVEQVSKRGLGLREISRNLERIQKVRTYPGLIQFLLECEGNLSTEIKSCTRSSKSPIISNKLRQEANEFYKGKDLPSALRGFTLSLLYAPKNSKEMVLGFSNRSACFMELNQFQECLQDIESALKILEIHSNDKDLVLVKQKLIDRKERSEKKVGESTTNEREKNVQEEIELISKHSELFMLKNPNKFISSAEEFVTIADDPSRGRHVKVTKDVPPGTVIILEEPYSKILVNQFKWETNFCHNCFKDLRSLPKPCIPCPECVFAVYCNEKCRETDAQIHKYDCKIAPYFHRLKLKRLVLLAFRTLLRLGPEGLKIFMKSESKKNADSKIYGFNSEGKYISSSYYPIHCLIYHDKSLTEKEISQYCMDSLFVVELLDKHSDFFELLHVPNEIELQNFKDFAASLILLHQMNFPCNAHSLNILPLNCSKPNISPEEIQLATTVDFGAGAFALLSMINHSCDPNVMRVTLTNGTNAVVTIHHLSAGDEVLDNYGAHYALDDYKHRQTHLMTNYNFRCECAPCSLKWPTMDSFNNDNVAFRHECVPYGQLKDNYKSIDKKSHCPKCAKNVDLKLQCNNLQKQIEKFDSAYNLVLQNNPYNSISELSKCLTYFDTFVLPPFIKTNFAQETLKQAFNLIATYKSQKE